jgi:flavin-dependent thymidylate synthase
MIMSEPYLPTGDDEVADFQDAVELSRGSLRKWADEHQYDAEPQPGATADQGVMPSVQIIHMPQDPLGVLAAQNAIYKGMVIRNLSEITDDMRRESFEDMMKTTLQSPLEAIKMHFLFEGVDRAFTHQHVRQRTANFGQESLRFSVVGPLIDATTLPPQLHGTQRAWVDGHADLTSYEAMLLRHDFTMASQEDRNRAVWDWCIHQIDLAYHYLVEHGIAAEEARGLLPHATATRIHYQTDMRGLMKVMGERLCTQAQFHWRTVAALVQNAVRNYTPDFSWIGVGDSAFSRGLSTDIRNEWERKNRWQFELIADSGIFRPVCYQTGHCMFQASADRGCTIRERVEIRAKNGGNDSTQWHKPFLYYGHDSVSGRPVTKTSEGIQTPEWLLNPAAARGE